LCRAQLSRGGLTGGWLSPSRLTSGRLTSGRLSGAWAIRRGLGHCGGAGPGPAAAGLARTALISCQLAGRKLTRFRPACLGRADLNLSCAGLSCAVLAAAGLTAGVLKRSWPRGPRARLSR